MREREDDRPSRSRRTCVVTGREAEPEAMLRFALSGEGVVTPDIRRNLPGRGVWTELSRSVVRQAATKQAFARGFRAQARVGPEIADLVDSLLYEDALRFLSLVNKAGLVVAGAAKVEAAIRAGRLAALVHARDGAPDGAGKLDRLAQGVLADRAAGAARINLFSSGQLDLALGRTNVIHAALDEGPASTAFLAKVTRLHKYRASETATTAPAAAGVGAVALANEELGRVRAGVIGRTHERNEQ